MFHRSATSPRRGANVTSPRRGANVTSPRRGANVTLMLLILAPPIIAPEALPAAGIPILGQVLGPDGEPRAKAEVRLESIPPTYERARLRLAGRAGPDPVAGTRTGTDGTFELVAPEAGMWKVVVSAPGVLTIEHRLITLVEETTLPPVRLTPAADLALRLLDAEGKPRPGAVGAFTLGIRGDTWRPRLRLAAAGRDGVAHLPLGQGEKIQLEVLADGHPLLVFELFDESSIDIDLPAGVAGTVRVVDRQKRPLAGAVAFQGSALLPLGSSDEEGRIPLVLQAKQQPALKVSTSDRQNGSFELGAIGDAEKVLRLDPPETVSGRVLDLSNRDPVADALVWAVRGELAVTDQQGRYALDLGVYKSRWLQAAAAGYQQGHSQLADTDRGQAPAIALAPATVLSGKVVDVHGGLLEGVAIELRLLPRSGAFSRAAHRTMRDGWRGRTSDRGAFHVAGLPAEIAYQLRFRAEGFAPHTLDIEPLKPFESRSGLEVVLEPGRLAFGRVVDEDEVPVAAAEVSLKAPPTDDLRTTMMTGRSEDAPEAPIRLTDAEGRFEIADLAVGRYNLEVRAAGFAPAKVPGVRVPEAGGADLGTVVLVPGVSIEGRVTDHDGAVIAGAEVTVEVVRRTFMGVDPSGAQDPVKTDTGGRFVVADLLPGQALRLSVTKEGYGSESLSDLRPPTDEPLAIVLEPAGRLEGKVVDRRGEPIRSATIMVNPDRSDRSAATMVRQRGRPAWARTGSDGHFLIADIDPGLLEVTARAEGYQHRVHTGIEMKAGAVHELELVLEAGAVVEGTLTTTDGEPVIEGSISVSERHDGFSAGRPITAASLSDVEGHYRVTGAPIGPATITARHDDGRRLVKNIEVRPGTNVVDLMLERGFEITGQVVTPDGNPVGGADLSIQKITQPGMTHYSFGSSRMVSTAAGTFTISGVSAGNYTVTASRQGYASARSEVFEVSGDVTGLLLELSHGASLKGRVLGLELDDLGSLGLVAIGAGGMRRGRVDFSAEYAFDSLAPGRWHVQAQIAGSGRTAMLQVEIPEGVAEVEKDIEFDTGLLTLTGIVLDSGQPLAGAYVSTAGSMSSMGQGLTGDDGRFRIDNLKAGSYQVMVSGMGFQHMEALELTGDHELRIEISTAAVAGIVRDAAGEPLAGVAVALEQLDAGDDWSQRFNFGSNRTETDSRGYFRLPRVRQGNWRVLATRQGYGPGEATVAVAGGGGATPEVEIRLTPTEGVSFEVALESGATVPAVQVVILDPAGHRLAAGSHMVIEGRVRVSTVPPGRWDLVIQGGDSAATRFAVTAPGDQGRLVLATGGRLNIRVPELESEMTMASVVLTGPDGRPFVSTMDFAFDPGEWMMSGGRSMVPGLTPGVWSFTVKHRDGRSWSGSATVMPGAATEVSLP